MSVQEGYGGDAAPALEFQSDFNTRPLDRPAQGDQSWDMAARNAPRSEGPLMTSGAGRPGQPMMGQRSIFGTGRGPVFAQMPAYTPVTRGPAAPEQHLPEPGDDYGSYARQDGAQPANPPRISTYANEPAQSYQHSYPSQNYQSPNYPPQSYPAEPRPAPSYQPQTYSTPAEPVQPRPAPASPSLRDTVFSGGAAPATTRADSFGDFPDRIFPEQISSEPSQADAGYGDASYAEPGYGTPIADASYQDASYPDGNAAETADASYTDASFSEASYGDASYADPNVAGGYADPRHAHQAQAPAGYPAAPHAQSYGEHEPLDLGGHDGYDASLEPDLLAEPARHDYGGQPQHQGQGGSRALQAFDVPYDQGAPQIQLGAAQYPPRADVLYDADQADADFLDEGTIGTTAQPAKSGLRGRSIFMVGSALLGAIALGGALAFAYKQSGGAMNDGEPPVVQADARPVKEVPQDAGGKDFPNKNKMIYERLQGGEQAEAEHIVPRQEELAMPAMPGPNPTAGLPTGAAPVAPPAVATVDDPEGGPRRVKTLVVKPDGSVMESPPEAVAAAQAPAAPQQVASADGAAPPPAMQPTATVSAIPPMPGVPAQAAPAPVAVAAAAPVAPPPAAAPVAADPQPVAAIPTAKPKPKPVVAAAEPEPQAVKPSKYVIQVGSKQNQTEALATFADIQQKYPTLVANYRPMVQKADLGAKGVWYRLRIGPIPDKAAASKLCTQLKSQGMPDCLVMAAQ